MTFGKSNCFFQLALLLVAMIGIHAGGSTLSAQTSLESGNDLWNRYPTQNSDQSHNGLWSPSSPDVESASLWTTEPGNSLVADTVINAAPPLVPTEYFASPTVENKVASQLWENADFATSTNDSQFSQNLQTPGRGQHTERRTTFGIEAVHLIRSGLSGGKFVVDDNGVALSYSDLDPGSSTDMRLRLSRVDGTGKGTEFVILKSNGFDERVSVSGPNVIPIFYYSIPATPQSSWDIAYNSDLDTYEFNWWGGSRPDFRVGIGGRYLNFRENFDITSSANSSSGFFSDTDNDLFGVQFLAEFRKWVNGVTLIEAGNRTGIYNNNIDVRAFAANGQLHRETNEFSFVGNWNAGVRVYSGGLGSWRLGYEAVMLSGVAIAPEQNEALRIFDPSANEIVTGTAFYHGVYGGFEFIF